MADSKLTDEQVADLVTILRGDSSIDNKVNHLNAVKSGIKQHNVPDSCVPQLFDGLRAASSSPHAALVNVGFTALNHLLTRLSRQEPKLLTKEAPRTLPLIIEKLGDQKDKFRSTALSSLNTLYTVAPADVERSIRNTALAGKNPRAKEGAMQWLLQTHQEQGLQFRSYVPLLMDLLEDADGMVRDAAKSTVIELFKNAPNAAKSDLKRQLKNFKVRPAIEQSIVKSLAPASARPETPAADVARPPSRPAMAASTSSAMSDRPITPAVDPRSENIEPQYVNTHRELDDIFKGMAWFFEGRESEQNWVKREESMTTLRRLTAGNAPADFLESFVTGLRAMLDGIIKAVNSLRTSLSKEGCGLVQDLAVTLGPAMDPLVELLMQTLVKLCAATKKITSQLACQTIDTLISRVSYSQRLMQHIWAACQDKNVQPRTYVSGWLKTILKKEAAHRHHMEHSGGLDMFEKCIKKGLGDANPAVREKMRSTFWAFWQVWPARADAIKDSLDATAQKLLNKDPGNPNATSRPEVTTRPGSSLSKSTSTMSGGKPSLREAMMAQKKATLDAKKLPARPGSAMAHITPARKASDSSDSRPTKPVAGRTRPESAAVSVNAGGMSMAPVRPIRRRPEVAPPARPATAGPYSVRDQTGSIEAESPGTFRAKTSAPRQPKEQPKETTPRRTVAQRPKPGHAPHASESSIIGSPGAKPRPVVVSPQISPARLKVSQSAHVPSSPPRAVEEAPVPAMPTASSAPEPVLESAQLVETQVSSPPVTQQSTDLYTQPATEPSTQPSTQTPSQPFIEEEEQPPAKEEQLPSEEPTAPAIHVPEMTLDSRPRTPTEGPLKVYEDPFVEEQQAAATKPTFTGPVLEDKPVNEGAAALPNTSTTTPPAEVTSESPEKARQNQRLLDSGLSKIKTRSLEVHGFRKFQSLLRDNKTALSDEKFEALVLGLFQYLEDPMEGTSPEKAQDVKAQILTTIKLLLQRDRSSFQPHVSKCLLSLLRTRSTFDNRAHIVSGLELLSDELVSLGDGGEMVIVLVDHLNTYSDATTQGCRALGLGLHVVKSLLDKPHDVPLMDDDLNLVAALASRCLESADSRVRMDAVQLCVSLHARVGDARLWDALQGIKDDPKSLITYYIVKKQREQAA